MMSIWEHVKSLDKHPLVVGIGSAVSGAVAGVGGTLAVSGPFADSAREWFAWFVFGPLALSPLWIVVLGLLALVGPVQVAVRILEWRRRKRAESSKPLDPYQDYKVDVFEHKENQVRVEWGWPHWKEVSVFRVLCAKHDELMATSQPATGSFVRYQCTNCKKHTLPQNDTMFADFIGRVKLEIIRRCESDEWKDAGTRIESARERKSA